MYIYGNAPGIQWAEVKSFGKGFILVLDVRPCYSNKVI